MLYGNGHDSIMIKIDHSGKTGEKNEISLNMEKETV